MRKDNFIIVNGKELRISSKITHTEDEKNNTIKLCINDPTANMQEDSNDFEGIVIWIWSIDPQKRIILKYEEYKGEEDHYGNKNKSWDRKTLVQRCYKGEKGRYYAEPKRLHYMRFLYRVMRFSERYSDSQRYIFIIDDSNKKEIKEFKQIYEDALNKGELWITKPTTEGDLKAYEEHDSTKIIDRIAENHLEKWFVIESEKNDLPKELRTTFGYNRLYDQLPCCLFIGEPSSTTRIFNAGYFDLWGINDKNELCVFELKKESNAKLGIISELFFYSMIMKDMKQASRDKYRTIKANHRGFKRFVASDNNTIVNGYFLVPQLHTSLNGIEDKFIDVLNFGYGNDSVKFGLISFSEEEIKKHNDFMNLSIEWKKLKNKDSLKQHSK